jgi:hypothetical protein
MNLVRSFGLPAVAAMGIAIVTAPTAVEATSGTVTYTNTVTSVPPPSSNFSGASAGGDGWAVALSSTQLFNVFHHQQYLGINCHNQADASTCTGYPKTITDGSGHAFWTSGQPGMYVDQTSDHLFVFATRSSDGTGGVVCIDTTSSSTDPFCGFTALTPAGEAPTVSGDGNISDPVQVGSNWYAYNYDDGTPTGAEDELLCFDLSTLSACASQPFAVSFPAGSVANSTFPEPSIAAFGSEIIVPSIVGVSNRLGCFDASSGGACAGSWPVAITASGFGAPFPLLNGSGNVAGFCLPTGTDQCYLLDGASTTTPVNLPTVITGDTGWNGPAVVLSPRVYVANGNANDVQCFDYNTGTACASFPKSFTNLGYIYTVNPDWQRPTCIWVNSDNGSEQIQDFDAYTGGVCGSGPLRVLAASAVAPGAPCLPGAWISLQVTTPAPNAYTSATVQFEDSDGNTIPGTSTTPLDATGSVNLSTLNLAAGYGLPEFLLTFTGASNVTDVVIVLTWTGTYDPSCAVSGTKVTGYTMTASATPPSTGSGSGVLLSVDGVPSGATGTVTFAAGGTTLCSAPLSSGTASCHTSTVLAVGSYSVTATYPGDPGDAGATASTAFLITAAVPVPATGAASGLAGQGALAALALLLLAVGGWLVFAARLPLAADRRRPSLSRRHRG